MRGDKNHEAQRDGREAPDQTQGQFSAFDANSSGEDDFRPDGNRSVRRDRCHESKENQRVSAAACGPEA
jgi:hypothetical protein